jgi:hypothetical protein
MTLNQITKKIKKIAEDHRQVRTVRLDDPSNFLSNETKDVLYPAVWFTLNGSDITGKEKTYKFVITIADILHPEDITETEVQSDCEQIADDILGFLNWGKQEWTYEKSTQYEYFREDFEDILAGVTFQISLKVPFVYDICDVPADYVLPDNEGVYINTNRFMTVVDFIVANGQPMVNGSSNYQNNLLTVPPFVFIGGNLITYQVTTDRRYISHDTISKSITVNNGGVLDGEHVFIII